MLKKRERLAVVLGIMGITVLVCLILILSALQFYLLEYATYQKSLVETDEKKYPAQDLLALKTNIVRYNASLAAADRFYKKTLFANGALKVIYRVLQPEGLDLDSITLELDSTGELFKAAISGKSATREALVAFKKSLEDDKRIKNVYFPPESWVKARGVIFYTTFEVMP